VHTEFDDLLLGRFRLDEWPVGRGEGHVLRDEIDYVVFQLGGPTGREGVFKAGAKQQTRVGGPTTLNKTAARFLELEIKAPEGRSRLPINQRAIDREAHAHGNVSIPPVPPCSRFTVPEAEVFVKSIGDAGPCPLTLKAKDELAGLIVAAGLTA